ncbi:unnamed protein product [Enterobius vermicularis]|uniref:TonB-dependent receptor n=1 Tax=Enterobius vermicularis TaxID=51028 RepID=A0A0N4V5H8_ENTVE|nr:unnamed protein product [Enterobius vermicularis]
MSVLLGEQKSSRIVRSTWSGGNAPAGNFDGNPVLFGPVQMVKVIAIPAIINRAPKITLRDMDASPTIRPIIAVNKKVKELTSGTTSVNG